MKRKDLTNQRFGKLVAIAPTDMRSPYKTRKCVVWSCLCDCGVICFLDVNQLTTGHNKSCGCAHYKNNGYPSAFNGLYADYRKGAKRRGLEFRLSRADMYDLTKQRCSYCGCEPNQVIRNPSWKDSYTYNGLDRVNNAVGYTLDNVVTCCKTCNYAKGQMLHEQFLAWIKQAYLNLFTEYHA